MDKITINKKNYIYVNPNRPIYRIIPLFHFIKNFKRKKSSLSKPKVWDDPNENYLLNNLFNINGEIAEFSDDIRDSIFGQCWSLEAESDALWRIYSPRKNGIRLKTTPKKLLKELAKNKNINSPELKCFIGKIKYEKNDNLIPALKDNLLNDDSVLFRTDGSGLAKSLLYKMDCFKYEKEIRLIYCGCKNDKNNRFYFDINPNELYDSLCFDPRLEQEKIKNIYRFLKRIGCQIKLEYSKLYTPLEKRII